MARARQIDQWNHTSALMALIHNLVSRPARSAADFHPIPAERPHRRGMNVGAFAKMILEAKHGRVE